MSYFFISYQRKNKRFAKLLKKKLEQSRILCWIDENIPLGDEWKYVIDTEIKASIGVIVIVTPEALKSQYVTYEWSYGMGLGKRVIPIILEYPDPNNPDHFKIHPKIDDRQNLDFSNSRKHPWAELTEKLELILKQEDLPKNIREAEEEIHSFDRERRRIATEFLMTHPHPAVVEIFSRAVQSESPEVSANAGISLAEKTSYYDDRAIVGLNHGLYNGDLRARAINALVNMNTYGAIQCLNDAFHESGNMGDYSLLSSVMKAMSRITNPMAIPYLRDMAISSTNVPMEVLDALGRFGDPQSLPELIQAANSQRKSPDFRSRAIRAIATIKSPDVSKHLYDIAKSLNRLNTSEENTVFSAIIESLRDIGTEDARSVLIWLKNDVQFRLFHNALVEAMQKMTIKPA